MKKLRPISISREYVLHMAELAEAGEHIGAATFLLHYVNVTRSRWAADLIEAGRELDQIVQQYGTLTALDERGTEQEKARAAKLLEKIVSSYKGWVAIPTRNQEFPSPQKSLPTRKVLLRVIERVVGLGQLQRMRRCEFCNSWMYADRKNQRFCPKRLPDPNLPLVKGLSSDCKERYFRTEAGRAELRNAVRKSRASKTEQEQRWVRSPVAQRSCENHAG